MEEKEELLAEIAAFDKACLAFGGKGKLTSILLKMVSLNESKLSSDDFYEDTKGVIRITEKLREEVDQIKEAF